MTREPPEREQRMTREDEWTIESGMSMMPMEAQEVIALLGELARLRRDSHPTWNEAGVTDEELDAWPDETKELWGMLHAALDRMPDEVPGKPEYDAKLERAYNAIPAICRLRAGAVGPAEAHPNE